MPSKRVSLKGKGADLFFGDYAPPTPPGVGPTAADDTRAPAASLDDAAGAALLTEDAPAPPFPEQPGRPADNPSASRPRQAPRRGSTASASARNGAAYLDSTTAITLASTMDSAAAETIEAIRKVVKVPGREVSFVRLTPEEKAHLGDVVYTFKRQGQKTTENEINRIALNYLLHDFQEHGERSVLARVLAALRA